MRGWLSKLTTGLRSLVHPTTRDDAALKLERSTERLTIVERRLDAKVKERRVQVDQAMDTLYEDLRKNV